MNFWQSLQKEKQPFFALAPMADVTDMAFREMFARYGKPDVMFTEFVACDGLVHPEGKEALLVDLQYGEAQRPIVAQLFGGKPENFYKSAKIIAELGFDGIDINMGCPQRIIEKQGAGASLIKNPELAVEIIKAVQKGIKDSGKNIPVSVKTRIGYNKNEIETWIPFLLKTGIEALTIHARTRKEMSKVPARWEHIKRVVEIRDELGSRCVIIGNGDVLDLEGGKKKADESGADGIMIGRGAFGKPWLFGGSAPKLKKRLEILLEHTKLFEEKLGKAKNFAIMKKHYKAYVQGFDGAKELRIELMNAKNADEVEKIIKNFLIANK